MVRKGLKQRKGGSVNAANPSADKGKTTEGGGGSEVPGTIASSTPAATAVSRAPSSPPVKARWFPRASALLFTLLWCATVAGIAVAVVSFTPPFIPCEDALLKSYASSPCAQPSFHDFAQGLVFSDVPPQRTFTPSPSPTSDLPYDGTPLSFVHYQSDESHCSAGGPAMVLIPPLAGNSLWMHMFAKSLLHHTSLCAVYSVDLRGHGRNPSVDRRGDVSYRGQYVADAHAFVDSVVVPEAGRDSPIYCAGHSYAGSVCTGLQRTGVTHGTVLIAPAVEPLMAVRGRGWISVSAVRVFLLNLLYSLGVQRFDSVPVVSLFVPYELQRGSTLEYSMAAAASFDTSIVDLAPGEPVLVIAGRDEKGGTCADLRGSWTSGSAAARDHAYVECVAVSGEGLALLVADESARAIAGFTHT